MDGAQNENTNLEQMLQTLREEMQMPKLQEDLISQFQGLSITNSETNESKDETTEDCSFQPMSIEVNSNLIYEFLHDDENYTCLTSSNNIYILIPLQDNCLEFSAIKNLFTSTIKRCFKVNNIMKIYNPYLLAQYKLMEKSYKKRYGRTSTRQLFHGTKRENIDSICKYNFDWRLKGTARGTRFGQGVYFTPISNYATYFGDKTYEKVMIVANVLVSNKFVGAEDTVIPPLNCDTTTKENEHVFVKYEDNTFYPAYVIYYEGRNNYKKNQPRRHFFI
ncbi:TCDD-inducible poly [ADP-ribose] polymerase-like [Anoplophora glabripennis]|uniref:TCDD-inducible poly [ADP-ribose] polymerase-like n=1 Tax=Anoplophora glabripennis TaxID=217634 RepID=UPI0008742612|nr:TCDD-inducible poly [ADP-ribose] polymerase-like [Anoplophora glabripennis]